jgi:hypothetical protein
VTSRGRVSRNPTAVRLEVNEAVSGYTLTDIRRTFSSEGFEEPPGFEPVQGRMRKSLVEAIDSMIDLVDADQVDAYLRVIERVLDQLESTQSGTVHSWAPERIKRIRRELARAGVTIESDGRLVLPRTVGIGGSLAGAATETGIRLAITRLERLDAEPEETIGAAKELVEATIKLALTELGEQPKPDSDVPELAKALHKRLKLDPKAIAPTMRGAETIMRILGGLIQVPQGLAELRNEGYGTGHATS